MRLGYITSFVNLYDTIEPVTSCRFTTSLYPELLEDVFG